MQEEPRVLEILVRRMAVMCQVRLAKDVAERGEKKLHVNSDIEKKENAWLQVAGGREGEHIGRWTCMEINGKNPVSAGGPGGGHGWE